MEDPDFKVKEKNFEDNANTLRNNFRIYNDTLVSNYKVLLGFGSVNFE